ncbi:uncharacterized protein G2W53_022280 [Senna tora]|uniref:Uncharacterized protein n=1 Tax=Senna tora TaxID=362788 RepID=A0A834WLX8_9FABA|nr:uncharacterized protein G2W53_022280 [Senna tora]
MGLEMQTSGRLTQILGLLFMDIQKKCSQLTRMLSKGCQTPKFTPQQMKSAALSGTD